MRGGYLARLASADPSLTAIDLDERLEAIRIGEEDEAEARGIGPQGLAELLAAMDGNASVVRLSLARNRLGDAGAARLAAAVEAGICSAVTELDVRGNRIGAAGAADLAQVLLASPRLAELDLSDNGAAVRGAECIAAALSSGSALRVLHIASNGLGPAGASALAGALLRNMSLTVLSIEDNFIGDVGAASMGTLLLARTPLTKLNLERNRIGMDGGKRVVDGLGRNYRLEVLGLDGNPCRDVGWLFDLANQHLRRNEEFKDRQRIFQELMLMFRLVVGIGSPFPKLRQGAVTVRCSDSVSMNIMMRLFSDLGDPNAIASIVQCIVTYISCRT